MKKILSGFLLLVFLIPVVGAFSVGTAPGILNIGDVRPGEEIIGTFYLLTNSENDLLIGLGYAQPYYGNFMKNPRAGFIPLNASEEDISSWVKFPENPVFISMKNPEIVVQLPGGQLVSANADVQFILKIPQNAEPGYHVGSIDLNPAVQGGGSGTAVSTIGLTRMNFILQVIPEPAVRKGKITSIIADRIDEDKARIDVIFQNTGTVTMITKLDEVKIFDSENNIVAVIEGGSVRAPPGKTSIITAVWVGAKPGLYTAQATVDWLTGSDAARMDVEVPKVIKATIAPPAQGEFPWWLLVLIILVIMLIIYWKW